MTTPTPPPEEPEDGAIPPEAYAAAAALYLTLIAPWLALVVLGVLPAAGVINPFGVLAATSMWAVAIRTWIRREVTPRLQAPFVQLFGPERGKILFDQHADTQQYLATVTNLLSAVPDEVFAKIRALIQKGSDDGTPTVDIADQIRTTLLDAGAPYWTNRAMTIARTELHTANEAGNFHAYADLAARDGLEFIKEWLDADDARVRPAHVDTDGQRRPLLQPFAVGVDGGPKFPAMYPGALNLPANMRINCRCGTLIEEAGERMTDKENRGFRAGSAR